MADVFGLAGSAIYTALTGNANLTALVGTRIYDSQAPELTPYPLVIFQQTAGGESNDTPRRNVDSIWRVECIGKILSDARLGASYIDDALRHQTLTMPGWSNWQTDATQLFSRVETIEGVVFWRRGSFYAISFDNNVSGG